MASSEWRDEDPSQWTGRDVFLILNNSPWSKKVKIKPSSEGLVSLTDQSAEHGDQAAVLQCLQAQAEWVVTEEWAAAVHAERIPLAEDIIQAVRQSPD